MSVTTTKLPPIAGTIIPTDLMETSNKLHMEETADIATSKKTAIKGHDHLQDGRSGSLDVWPANAIPHIQAASVPATISKANNPKPKFLKDLELFLHRELSVLYRIKTTSREARLQIYRQVFEFLIQEFKTYKPLLASIKNEYEIFITGLKDKVAELEPLKSMIVTVAEECDQKIMQLRDLEKKEFEELRKENRSLTDRIEDMKEDRQTLVQMIEKLQSELAAEHKHYRDEADGRKLLVQDINDLRYQYEELIVARDQGRNKDNAQEDPVMLRMALERSRKDLNEAQDRITEYQANYGDVVPRREYEKMKQTNNEMNELLINLKKQLTKLSEEHGTLQAVYKQVLEQRNEYARECELLRRSATPRPDWSKCGPFIEGGSDRWAEIAQDRTSDQLVDILLAEIAGADPTNIGAVEHFQGLGMDESIPRYLRYEGTIRNRRISKEDIAYLIKEIWEEKAKYDAQNFSGGNRSDIQDFVYEHLKKRFESENIIVEWGYNLHHACQRLSSDPQIGLFYHILSGEVDEIIYHNQQQLFDRMKLALSKMPSAKEGSVSAKDFEQTLRKILTNRTEKDYAALEESAKAAIDAGAPDTIKYSTLFEEDSNGMVSPFLSKVMEQQWNDRTAYLAEIEEAIGKDKVDITVEEAREAIKAVDPTISPPALEACLSRGFGYVTLVPAGTSTEVATFIQLISFGDTNRHGKPMSKNNLEAESN